MINTNLLRVLKGSDIKLLPTILTVAIGMSLGTVGPASYAHGADDDQLDEILARDDLSPDTDGDGIPNTIDIDDDNDGIIDGVEGIVDADGDGFADANSTDTDNDGTPDGYDLDSDNDGILDIVESHVDLDLINSLDIVANGAIDITVPVGANGLADILETSVDSAIHPYKMSNADGDSLRDFRDLDSDGDGIFDVIEAGGIDADGDGLADGFVDLDGKGVNDLVEVASLPLFDTDGDSILDFRDEDSDNDTLPDSIEAGSDPSVPTDSDNDGAADFRESDSDGDGVGDIVEAGGSGVNPVDTDNDGVFDFQDPTVMTDLGNSGGLLEDPVTQPDPGTQTDPVAQPNPNTQPDFDGDGIANVNDLDDDNDGLLDTEEGVVDADQDGIPEANSTDSDVDGVPDGYDLDSDNDGILDIVEGRLPADRVNQIDPNGTGSAASNIPVGNNGIVDSIETATDSNTIFTPVLDTDNDGTPDFRDIDSDSDGIVDLVEAGGVDEDFDGRIDDFQDNDNGGVDDDIQAVGLPMFDTDNDGIRDFLDLDSDQDSIPDQVESGGVFITPIDSDQDGAADYRESDSDNDGVSDTIEAGPNPQLPVDSDGDLTPDFQDSTTQFQGNGGSTPVQPGANDNADTDGDGTINSDDADDDNDGIPDVIEGLDDNDSDGIPNSLDRDSDNDGVFDSRETANDSDGDTVPDFLDLDSDNDGVFDAVEAGREGVANTGRLQSAATVDQFGLAQGASDLRLETDGDGIVDMLDLDTDNDTLLDVIEAGFPQAGSDGRITPFNDANGDGADDSIPTRSTTLIDTDGDRIPDIRDLDSDQDGLSDLLEMSGPARDQDNSGDVDNFSDDNGDGLDDTVAANPTSQTDTDNDRSPNNVDLDSDNDGMSDLDEAGGVDANNDNRNDLLSDADLDGIPDQNDIDVTGGADVDGDGIDDTDDIDFAAGPDSDGDGIVDSQDPDSDGDGFAGPANDGTGTGLGNLIEGQPVNLPDSNGDGIPDVTDGFGGSSGIIQTGLDASGFGCSIATASSSSKSDPTVAFLLGGSFLFLVFRQRRRKVARVAVVAGSAVLAGCSTLGLDFDLDPSRLIPSDPDFEKRLYVGAGVLASQLEPDTDQVAGVSVADTDGSGGSATIGYDFTNRISFEGHYADLGEAVLDPAGTVGYSVAGLSALYYGFNDERNRARRTGLSAFGKLGVGAMENDVTVVPFERINDFHLLAGLGLEYGMQNGFAVRGEFTAHDTDARYAQLGVIYRFGGQQADRFPTDRSPRDPLQETVPSVASVDVDPFPQGPVDNDADGVPDVLDSCPTTSPGTPVDSDGCAIFDGAIEGINFQTNSDQLTADSVDILQGVAQTLREYPDVRVTIEAHTDNLGNASDNLLLSKRRAISVARFLVDQGIAGSRLRPQAYGESKPRTSNATSQGRATNRRVEFSVL